MTSRVASRSARSTAMVFLSLGARRGGTGRSLPADARALLLRTAAISGGAVVQSGGSGPFTAALRLPLRTDLPLRVAEEPETLLWDRYSPLQLFLPGFCAGANE